MQSGNISSKVKTVEKRSAVTRSSCCVQLTRDRRKSNEGVDDVSSLRVVELPDFELCRSSFQSLSPLVPLVIPSAPTVHQPFCPQFFPSSTHPSTTDFQNRLSAIPLRIALDSPNIILITPVTSLMLNSQASLLDETLIKLDRSNNEADALKVQDLQARLNRGRVRINHRRMNGSRLSGETS